MLSKLVDWFIYLGIPAVAAYHAVCSSVFLNTVAEDAVGLEWVGNTVLTPVQFILGGKEAIIDGNNYRLKQRFDYNTYLPLKSTASILSFPIALPVGTFLKATAYLSTSTRMRHAKIVAARDVTDIVPNLDYYRELGLPITEEATFLEPPQYRRRPGEEKVLSKDKALLADIVHIFNENKIPYWVEAGTCLGAYRYGGVIPWDFDIDMAILLPDFENAWRALGRLDKAKYQVQDWSSRCYPKTYIRVFIYETHSHIDIFCFTIDPVKKSLAFFLSNKESSFMTEKWKAYEERFTVPTAYDIIFPLKKADFDGIEVFVPNQTKKYLQDRYGEDLSPVKVYNELTGEYEQSASHPYWRFARSN